MLKRATKEVGEKIMPNPIELNPHNRRMDGIGRRMMHNEED
jgi:hypothetical protein